MNQFETVLLSLSELFFWPTTLLILLAFAYAFFAIGETVYFAYRRRQNGGRLLVLHREHPEWQIADLELAINRDLEMLKLCSRTAPLLGLVATLIPLAPALNALGKGDMSSVGHHMSNAFSAVIIALIAAALAFVLLSFRRRWALEELRLIERLPHVTKPSLSEAA